MGSKIVRHNLATEQQTHTDFFMKDWEMYWFHAFKDIFVTS